MQITQANPTLSRRHRAQLSRGPALKIGGHSIAVDHDGHIAIGDLHLASGGDRGTRPELFLASQSFKRLLDEVDTAETGIPAIKGKGRGAYLSKELAFAYASWVSTSFALRLIRGIDRDLPLDNMPQAKLSDIEPEFAAACRLAERFGLKGNQLLLSAARAVRLMSGVDPTELLGMDGLVVESGIRHYTPSQLGRLLGTSGRNFNQLLVDRGFQERLMGQWVATDQGRPYSVLVDTAKQHNNGQPIQQLRWLETVVEVLPQGQLLGIESGGPAS